MTNQAGTNEGSSAGTTSTSIAHHASRRAIVVAWSLRAAIVATAIFHAIEGEILYVILCLGALALLVTPPLLARSSRANLPIELEIIMLWWFVGDMALGRAAKLYETSLWFDKALHLGNSIVVAMVAFLVIYLLQMTCCLSGPRWTRGVLIVVVTLGIGAGWEILEYLADAAFGRGAQGSPMMAPLDDTMWDLMLDGLGGLIGGLLGPIYMRSGRSHNRVRGFRQLAGMYCNHEETVESCRYCGDGAPASTASGLTRLPKREEHEMEHDHGSMTGDTTNVSDPVCGMSVDPARAAATLHLGDRIFHFCSDGCRKTFIEDPDRHAGRVQAADGARPPANDVSPGEWTCPMHPDVRAAGPGPCPKCGMSLEPVTPPSRSDQWTCPMHPEVVQDSPGTCPICGMSLEPRDVTEDEEHGSELCE